MCKQARARISAICFPSVGHKALKHGQKQTFSGTTENPFTREGMKGYWFDSELDTYHLGLRDYDTGPSRFMSKDPVEVTAASPNPYEYVANDPINKIDPSGLQAEGTTARFYGLDVTTGGAGTERTTGLIIPKRP